MTNNAAEQEPLDLEIEFIVPPDMPGRYATNIVVQQTANEFVVYFFEVHQPLILGDPETMQDRLREIGTIPARCISKLIIAPNRMQDFLGVLQTSYEKYQLRGQEETNDNE